MSVFILQTTMSSWYLIVLTEIGSLWLASAAPTNIQDCLTIPELCPEFFDYLLPPKPASGSSVFSGSSNNGTKQQVNQTQQLFAASSFNQSSFNGSTHTVPSTLPNPGTHNASIPHPQAKNWTVEVVKIPGLSSDTTTNVTIAGNQTQLPVYYNSTGVGVIVLPVVLGGVILAGTGAIGPKPPLPIFLDGDGKPILSESEQEEISHDCDDDEEGEDDDPEPPDTNTSMSASFSSSSTSASSSSTKMIMSPASTQSPSSTISSNFSSTVATANSTIPTATANASMDNTMIFEPMDYWIVPMDEGYEIGSLIHASINADQSNRLQNNCSKTASANSTNPHAATTYLSLQPSSGLRAPTGTGGLQLLSAGNLYGMKGSFPTPTSSSTTGSGTSSTIGSGSSVPNGVLVPCGYNASPPKTRCPDRCPFKEIGQVDPGDGGPLIIQGFCDNTANLPG